MGNHFQAETRAAHSAIMRSAARRAFALAILALLGFAVVAAFVVQGLSEDIDARFITFARLTDPASTYWRILAIRDVTALGSMIVLTFLVVSTSAFLLASGHRRLALVTALSASAASFMNAMVKGWFGRTRPETAEALLGHLTGSFPSGHAFLSSAILLSIAGIAGLLQRTPLQSAVLYGFGIVIVLLVGTSRVLLGVHWPSDVLGGWMLGFAWSGATIGLAVIIGGKDIAAIKE
jgi:undecaprenyl-diphosphatase